MYIEDKSQSVVAFIADKLIFQPDRKAPIGIILGNCVYNTNGVWAGKLFNNYFRNPQGYITGKVGGNWAPDLSREYHYDSQAAWAIINRIYPQDCGWITPREEWGSQSFLQFLQPTPATSPQLIAVP